MYAIKRKLIDGLLELVTLSTATIERPATPETAFPPELRIIKEKHPTDYWRTVNVPAQKPRGYDKWADERKRNWVNRFNKKRERIDKAWQKSPPAEAFKIGLGYGVTASTAKSLAARTRLMTPADQRQFAALERSIKRLQQRRTQLIGTAWERGRQIKAADLIAAVEADKKASKRKREAIVDRYLYGRGGAGLDHTDSFMPEAQREANRKADAERAARQQAKAAAERAEREAEAKAWQKAHNQKRHKPQDRRCPKCRPIMDAESEARYQAQYAARLAAEEERRKAAEDVKAIDNELENGNATCDSCGARIYVDEDTDACPECGSEDGATYDDMMEDAA